MSNKLEAIRTIAALYPRCCDLFQDGFGVFACRDCQQKTFAMMKEIQNVLGVGKSGEPISAEDAANGVSRAMVRNAAPDLLKALEEAKDSGDWRAFPETYEMMCAAIAAAKAESP